MESKLDDFRDRSRQIWDSMAPGWETGRQDMWAFSRPISEWLVDQLAPQPGHTVLDLAAGLGESGFLASSRVGPTGRILVTDFAPSMVAAARRRATEFGVTNAEFRELDAERMALPSASVDGVMCRWGYMLMADPAAAFAETHRVLRPGGGLVFSVFGPPDRNVWASLVGRLLVAEGHMPPPVPGAPGIFALGDPQRITALVTAAGFPSLEIAEMALAWPFPDLNAYWWLMTEVAGAISPILRGLSAEAQLKLRGRIEAEARPFRRGSGYAFPALCLNVATRKSA